jgi:large subunit ribosomal protein L13
MISWLQVERMAVEKTYVIKGKAESKWILVDANDQGIGRMATQIALYLMGKHKPEYTPGVDMGDHVVVINASLMKIPQKRLINKMYYTVSQFPGGIKSINLRDLLDKNPERVVRRAVWGMLPHNKLGREIIKRLKVYGGNEHPHDGQNPQPIA